MDKTQLDDEAIGVLVDAKIRETTTWYNSKLSTEREEVIQYYNGDKPERSKEGSSPYISNDVYDSVEGMKAQLIETFASGFEIVKFDPQNQQDVETSRIATLYTDYVVFRQNKGYSLFTDVIHDGLTARVGVVKVWWDEHYDYQDEEFENLSEDEVNALAQADEVEELDAHKDDTTGLYKGTIKHKIDNSKVVIESVNPEEFSVEREAKDINSGDYFCCQSTYKTYAELVRLGYPESKLKNIGSTDDLSVDFSPERLARFKDFETGVRMKQEDDQDERRHILVHECYLKMVREGDGNHERLYKVVRVANVTLEIEQIDHVPFLAFVPIPIPHSFYGTNYAFKIIQTQNVRSTLTRQIVDHANITNNPRYMVLRGGLSNPRELLDNRLGGLVNVTRPDAVVPLPQTSLNPFVFQSLQLMEANNEKTTGISSLSQGLNKDAISNQNSQGMVNDLVNLSQTRQKVIARNFANNFLIPLYLRIYQLVLDNEKKQNIVELAGNWVQIDPRLWRERKTATVSFHLGYGEQDREADKRMQLFSAFEQDPKVAAMITQPNAYKFVTDICKMKGIANVNDYFTPPNQLPPPQPDPMAMAELKVKQTTAQAAMITAQSHQEKVQTQAAFEGQKLAQSKTNDKVTNNLKVMDEKRKLHETANHIDISQREMHMAETNPNKDEDIVSPSG